MINFQSGDWSFFFGLKGNGAEYRQLGEQLIFRTNQSIMDKQTLQRYQHQKNIFCSINSVTALSQLLRTDKRRLMLLSKKASYKTFTIPKKGGGQRVIEAPGPELKRVLGRLNPYLQSVYFFEKSKAAYGFILGVKNDHDRRNVLSNARKHVKKPYLLNVDLKDFFHAVTRENVIDIFAGKPFKFRRPVYELLADLTTYHDRLPMGTATSPVLSNFACRELDEALQTFSEAMLWSYTRYADDMSFSSHQLINAEKINSVSGIIRQYGFTINPRKIKMFGPEEPKIVTGLLVTDTVTLAPGYLELIESEINQLQTIMKNQNEQGHLSTKWVDQFKQQIRGRLSFAGFVLKRRDERYQALKDAFYTAINPPEEAFGAVNWRGFPYNM